jgi:hypothetical protein
VTGDRRAGESARAEYERRKAARAQRHRDRFGSLAPFTLLVEGRQASEEAWRQGAEGEEFTARRLDKHLRGTGVVVHHDLAVPGSRANIDHVCIGPGGVTVVDSKKYSGKVEVRRGELRIGGRDRSKLITAVLGQIDRVRCALDAAQIYGVDVRGALAMANVEGLPLFGTLTAGGVLVGGTRQVAKLARRKPGEQSVDVDLVAAVLRARFGRG